MHAKKMLVEWDFEVPKGEKKMSIHQSELTKKDIHNFQMHAKKMPVEWDVEVYPKEI